MSHGLRVEQAEAFEFSISLESFQTLKTFAGQAACRASPNRRPKDFQAEQTPEDNQTP